MEQAPKILCGVYAIDMDGGFFAQFCNWYRENPSVTLDLKWKQSIAHAQTDIVKKAIRDGYTHVLFIETDSYDYPDNILDVFLSHDKDIVSAFSYSRYIPHPANVYARIKRREDGLIMTDDMIDIDGYLNVLPMQGLQQVDYTSFQFMLMKTEVIEKLEFPWFTYYEGWAGVTDKTFSRNCEKSGVEMWCDTNMVVRHKDVDIETRVTLIELDKKKQIAETRKTGKTKNGQLSEEALKRSEEGLRLLEETGRSPEGSNGGDEAEADTTGAPRDKLAPGNYLRGFSSPAGVL